MVAYYKGKRVKIIGFTIKKTPLIAYPLLTQVKIEYMKGGEVISESIDANLIELSLKK